MGTPPGVILLRLLAFLTAAFLLAVVFLSSGLSGQPTSPGDPVIVPSGQNNQSDGGGGEPVWQGLLELLPEAAVEKAGQGWRYGQDNPMAVASVGLLTCVTAILLAGPGRYGRVSRMGLRLPLGVL